MTPTPAFEYYLWIRSPINIIAKVKLLVKHQSLPFGGLDCSTYNYRSFKMKKFTEVLIDQAIHAAIALGAVTLGITEQFRMLIPLYTIAAISLFERYKSKK